MSLLSELPRACIRRPRLAIGIMLALVLLSVPGLLRLRLSTDGRDLVPPNDPAVQLDASVRRHFDLRDPIVVLITSARPDGIYNRETLLRVRELSAAFSTLEGVGPEHVMSLATERRDRVYPGTLDFRPFLSPFPDSPQAMAELRSDVDAAEILTGTLVSPDARSATILVGVPPIGEAGDRISLYRRIEEEVEPHRTPEDHIVVVGAPVAEALLGTHLLEDLTLLVPLSLLLISLMIWIGCRRIRGVFLGVTEVGACLLWTFGLMGWTGVPVYLTIAVLPVILTTIGLTDEIHVFWHYQRVLANRETGPHPEAVIVTLDEMVRPVVLTSLTTSIGFLSFLLSPIEPVRAFGLFAAAGILFCMLWTLTVVPAALALFSPERMRRPVRESGPGWTLRGTLPLIRRRRLTLAVVLLVTLTAMLGLRRIQVQDSWIGGFASNSPFRQATDLVNAQLFGTHLLLVHLDFAGRGSNLPLLEPEVLDSVGEFEAFVRSRPGVGGVLGVFSHFEAVHFLSSARRAERGTLPRDPDDMKRLKIYFDKVRGEQRRRQILDDELRRTVVTILLKNANYRDTARLMQAVREYASTHLARLGATLDFAGDVAVSQAMIPAIVRTQVSSLLLAFAIIFGVVSLLLRSVPAGLYATLPATIAALWVLGAMGWLGIPLGVATSMFCAITLGVGVDYAIHFLEGVRRARASGRDPAVQSAVAEVGPAILVDTLAIALGFGLLTISSVPANARLGLVVALALVAGCVLTLGGLGALLGERG